MPVLPCSNLHIYMMHIFLNDLNAFVKFAAEIIGDDLIIFNFTNISINDTFYSFYNIIKGIIYNKLIANT